mgnify:CR=1 FL=1
MISRDTLFSGPGGDTVQMQQTSTHLEDKGVEIDILLTSDKIEYDKYDLLHFFNIIRVSAILPHLNRTNKPFVLSPIFVDYSEYDQLLRNDIIGKLTRIFGRDGSEYFKTLARRVKNGESINSFSYVLKGQRKSMEKVLNKAKVILPNSNSEYQRLTKAYNFKTDFIIVPNGVDLPTSELSNKEIKKGVLCVGRIESYKNQLNIIKALKGTGINLTIVGKAAPNHIEYYESCKTEAGTNVRFIDHIPHHELVKLYQSHKVHVSASWFETTGLCNLEAALEDCVLVITKKGDTKDYFKNDVLYCDPNDIESIRNQIEIALKSEPSENLKKRIKEEYTWEKAATETLNGYHKALNINE